MVAFLNPVFDLLFGWMLALPPFWSICILSLIVSLIIVVITKYTTDQDLMKHLKSEGKELQKQMKTLKDDPKKMLEVQKQHMDMSMKMMRQSFRPLLFTFLPIILIFGWINANLSLEPLHPGEEFSVKVQLEKNVQAVVNVTAPEGIQLTSDASKDVTDGVALFTFKAEKEGAYTSPGLTFDVNGKVYTQDVIVSNEREYATPLKQVRDKTVRSIETAHESVTVIRIGSFTLNWLWSYIIFSIFFSSLLRKLFKVY